jgi:hypothetical protein
MFKERSATDIAEEIRKDRTTVSRYLIELKDLDLITFNTHGRELLYKATLPTKIHSQLIILSFLIRFCSLVFVVIVSLCCKGSG